VRHDPGGAALEHDQGADRDLVWIHEQLFQSRDLTHAITLTLLALVDRPRRPLATRNALVASAFALAGLREALAAEPSGSHAFVAGAATKRTRWPVCLIACLLRRPV
jgi:hypothetical protein